LEGLFHEMGAGACSLGTLLSVRRRRQLYMVRIKMIAYPYTTPEKLYPSLLPSIGNVIYQSTMLLRLEERRISEGQSPLVIRTGTPMFDGFDDSSTFMSGAIAQAFVSHYPESGFDCPNVTSRPLSSQSEFDWLSWVRL